MNFKKKILFFCVFKLWTMYCEQVNRGHDTEALVAIMDFWARITPGILHLLSHSKVVCRNLLCIFK